MRSLRIIEGRRVEHRQLVADGATPVAVYRAIRELRGGPSFLFESAPAPETASRYSIVGTGERGRLRVADGRITLTVDGEPMPAKNDPLMAARELLARLRPRDESDLSPFLGAYGAAAFEFAGYLERLPELPRNGDPMPDLFLIVPESVAVFDHFTHRVSVATLSDAGGDCRDDLDLCHAVSQARIAPLSAPTDVIIEPETGPLSYRQAVERAKESIAGGDAFQIVVSQRWTARCERDPFEVYRALRAINPSPYMFYLDLGFGELFGSSPELLARLDRRRACIRPLAGTRPRSRKADDDRKLAAQLKRDEKERAEHVMLVDLGRNDLGRVCTTGSVRPTRLFAVERYSHVMHLMSEVVGTLRPDRDAFDLFAAAFPAGTVSGAPKIRAMELIAELEGKRRGFYGGSVAHVGFDGSLEACITLRSAHYYGGAYHLQAGAGVVADSQPAREDGECGSKAQALVEALSSGGAPS